VILIVICVKILPLNGHFAKNFILLQVAVPVIHIHRQVTEPTGYLKLELLPKKWAANKLNINTTVKDQQLDLQHRHVKLAAHSPHAAYLNPFCDMQNFQTMNTDYNFQMETFHAKLSIKVLTDTLFCQFIFLCH
jgi:hypothetical protein